MGGGGPFESCVRPPPLPQGDVSQMPVSRRTPGLFRVAGLEPGAWSLEPGAWGLGPGVWGRVWEKWSRTGSVYVTDAIKNIYKSGVFRLWDSLREQAKEGEREGG